MLYQVAVVAVAVVVAGAVAVVVVVLVVVDVAAVDAAAVVAVDHFLHGFVSRLSLNHRAVAALVEST